MKFGTFAFSDKKILMKKTQSDSQTITSTQNLNTRLAANKRATRDFDEWCFRQLPELSLAANVLDLGCGTGKQMKLFSPVFSPNAAFYGMDLSEESLEELATNYDAPPKLHLIEGSFDELDQFKTLEPASFDLIYASYALYYTHDLQKVMADSYKLLKPGGIFWVIAPYSGTNDEFLKIIRPLHEVEPFMDYVFDDFHKDVVAVGEKTGFKTVKPSMLRNQIKFPSGEAFFDYLSHSLFYRPGFDSQIQKAVQDICDTEGYFAVSKHIISLQLKK